MERDEQHVIVRKWFLKSSNVILNKDNWSLLLHVAMYHGYLDIIQKLFKYNAAVNILGEDNVTFLHKLHVKQ